MKEHCICIYLLIVLLLANLHFDISGDEIVVRLLAAVALWCWRMRCEVLLILVHRPTALPVVLLLLESFFHERVLVGWVQSLRIRLDEISVILLNGIASLRFLLNAYLIVRATALIA
jgi:hypothetical protein